MKPLPDEQSHGACLGTRRESRKTNDPCFRRLWAKDAVIQKRKSKKKVYLYRSTRR